MITFAYITVTSLAKFRLSLKASGLRVPPKTPRSDSHHSRYLQSSSTLARRARRAVGGEEYLVCTLTRDGAPVQSDTTARHIVHLGPYTKHACFARFWFRKHTYTLVSNNRIITTVQGNTVRKDPIKVVW